MPEPEHYTLECRPPINAATNANSARSELLAILEPLAPADWACAATLTEAGKVLERTMLSYAQWLALHERPYVKQIERIVNTMHN